VFGLSFWEIAIILAIALIVLGPKKLPELARSLGKGIKEFRKATEDFKSTMDSELHADDRTKKLPDPGHTEALKAEQALEKEAAAEAEAEIVAKVESAQTAKPVEGEG
jgi:TatA/E family protein of Tat protein translocase